MRLVVYAIALVGSLGIGRVTEWSAVGDVPGLNEVGHVELELDSLLDERHANGRLDLPSARHGSNLLSHHYPAAAPQLLERRTFIIA